MSDTYHYEAGAIHNDHKRVVNVTATSVSDTQTLIKNFFSAGKAEDAEEVKCEEVHAEVYVSQTDAELIEKLKPIFYNNEGNVRLFLKELSGMKSGDITDLVNRWVKEKRISDYGYSRKGLLWKILNDAGLYTKSRQNWCKRVD